MIFDLKIKHIFYQHIYVCYKFSNRDFKNIKKRSDVNSVTCEHTSVIKMNKLLNRSDVKRHLFITFSSL